MTYTYAHGPCIPNGDRPYVRPGWWRAEDRRCHYCGEPFARTSLVPPARMVGPLPPYTVSVERIEDGRSFLYGFDTFDGAESFRARYLAPLPDGLPARYTVSPVYGFPR